MEPPGPQPPAAGPHVVLAQPPTPASVPSLQLRATRPTPASFAPFGSLVAPTEDGAAFDAACEPTLSLAPQPRLYVMRLGPRPPTFDRITRHLGVGQCLGALGDGRWWLAVAPPGLPLDASAVVAFEMAPCEVLALDVGTWHAGPFFAGPSRDFVNLEGRTTNVDDHDCRPLGAAFTILPAE